MTQTGPDRKPLRVHLRGVSVAAVQASVIRMLVDVLVMLVLIVLVWVVLGVARDVWIAITTRSPEGFKSLSIELLTVFVFIELFHSLSEYMRFQRVRVTHLLDASLAFVLREVWVGMYGGHLDSASVFALAGLVLALGIVRTLAVVYSPGERAAEIADAQEVEVQAEELSHQTELR
ncbi:MAG: phosphate-starvation-inducible PsiE family protein [Coriobacteriia bacterium]|jgi:uncharacterized membrane protein (DUF373 family)